MLLISSFINNISCLRSVGWDRLRGRSRTERVVNGPSSSSQISSSVRYRRPGGCIRKAGYCKDRQTSLTTHLKESSGFFIFFCNCNLINTTTGCYTLCHRCPPGPKKPILGKSFISLHRTRNPIGPKKYLMPLSVHRLSLLSALWELTGSFVLQEIENRSCFGATQTPPLPTFGTPSGAEEVHQIPGSGVSE